VVNRPGFEHIAFGVSDVVEPQLVVLEAGGGTVGNVVTIQLPTGSKVTRCNVRDPEGNIIELKSWIQGNN
jgi:catechol 2,3-dioxygenase-like lactoylglutathione lyase family enzyme